MYIQPITYNSFQYNNYQNSKKPMTLLTFTSVTNFESPIRSVSKATEESLNLYMKKILSSTIQIVDKTVKHYFTPIFKNLLSVSKTENEFYENLSGIVCNYISNGSFIKSNNRKNCYVERTIQMLEGQKLPQNAVYVDIGCGNGAVTKSISGSLNIARNNVFGLEVFEPAKTGGLNIIKYDGCNIPQTVPNSDFITLYTVLHHMEDEKQADDLLKSVYNKMNAKGYLLIREHEVNNDQDVAFWKIIHDINSKVMKRTSTDLNNGTLYISSMEWETKLQNTGFKFVKKWYDLHYNKQSSYFLLVQK